MRAYELVVVLRSALKEEERKKVLESIKSQLKDMNIVKEEEWGSKALKYAIRKELTGFYQFLRLESEKAIPSDLEKKLINNENILRHLLVRTK